MVSTQKQAFLAQEGDRWFERNRIFDKMMVAKIKDDPVLQVLQRTGLAPTRVLEIGASNGWRLHVLRQLMPGLECTGIEPSEKAVADAFPDVSMTRGTADALSFDDGAFDTVIFGFCLYLCDRFDLFRIAAEADRVLAENGHIVIYDFHTDKPYRNPYVHRDGLFSYKMDYSLMFSWNPIYRVVGKVTMPHPGTTDESPDNCISVTILQKEPAEAWPDNPYKK